VGFERASLALTLALPAGILLHALAWYHRVLRRERAARIAALPADEAGHPRSFHPDPIAAWLAGQRALCLCAALAVAVVWAPGYFAGLVLYGPLLTAYILVATGAAWAAYAADWTAQVLVTIRVEQDGIAYARGRAPLTWTQVPWSGITQCIEKTGRG
jgi:hypothetical protein